MVRSAGSSSPSTLVSMSSLMFKGIILPASRLPSTFWSVPVVTGLARMVVAFSRFSLTALKNSRSWADLSCCSRRAPMAAASQLFMISRWFCSSSRFSSRSSRFSSSLNSRFSFSAFTYMAVRRSLISRLRACNFKSSFFILKTVFKGLITKSFDVSVL